MRESRKEGTTRGCRRASREGTEDCILCYTAQIVAIESWQSAQVALDQVLFPTHTRCTLPRELPVHIPMHKVPPAKAPPLASPTAPRLKAHFPPLHHSNFLCPSLFPSPRLTSRRHAPLAFPRYIGRHRCLVVWTSLDIARWPLWADLLGAEDLVRAPVVGYEELDAHVDGWMDVVR